MRFLRFGADVINTFILRLRQSNKILVSVKFTY